MVSESCKQVWQAQTQQGKQTWQTWSAKTYQQAQSQRARTKRTSVRDAQSFFFHGSEKKLSPRLSQFAGVTVDNDRRKLDH